MNWFLLLFVLLLNLSLNNAETDNGSITSSAWFWAIISIGLFVILSVPCIMLVVYIACKRKEDLDTSIEWNPSSNDSSESIPIPEQPNQSNTLQRYHSHFVDGFPSPPPPYATHKHHRRLFATTSPPPSYISNTTSEEDEGRQTISNDAIITINIDESEQLDNSPSQNVTENALNRSFISNDSSEHTCYL